MIQLVGLATSALLLSLYLGMALSRIPARTFHVANAALWPLVALASYTAGAWGPLLLNVGFGAAGTVGVLRTNRGHHLSRGERRRRWRESWKEYR